MQYDDPYAVVANLRQWKNAGCPTTEKRRAWAAAVYRDLCADAFFNYAPQAERDKRNGLRPAISGSSYKHCPRQLWYSVQGAEKRKRLHRSYDVFAIGNLIEAIVVPQIILSGQDVIAPNAEGGGQYECVLEVDGKEYRSHPDIVLGDGKGGKILVEVKGLNPYTFDDWLNGPRWGGGRRGRDKSRAGPNNDWGYLSQVNFNMAAEDAASHLFIGVNKLQQDMRQWEVKRDPALIDEIKAAIRAAESPEPPPRPAWSTTVRRPVLKCDEIADKRCGSYCDFNEVCYPGFKFESEGRTPTFRKYD